MEPCLGRGPWITAALAPAVPSRPPKASSKSLVGASTTATLVCLAQVRGRSLRRAEASDLEKEAARIRAEAQALEQEQMQQRRSTRALEWTEGQTSCSLAQLRRQLEKVEKVDFSESELRDLLDGKEASTATLSSEAFEVKLRMLVTAKKETQLALQAAMAKERQQQAQAESLKQEIDNVFANEVDGEDRSLGVRLVAVLAYLLPLLDGFQFGVPLLELVPAAVPLVKSIVPLLMLKNTIPFGTFIFLILFQAQARNEQLPQILRFNLAQAVVLDVLFIIPDFFMSIISMQLPSSLLVALFVILFGVILYSVTLTMLGKLPDGLGGISDMTRRNLGR